ncbi:uncharacterized protein [Anabrus simplex]|uniref:uncharacterized protein isoform X2 n=1 Tax=Anabrus simplex TaxID=316456 RepID=UPI0035A33D45
MKISPQLLDIPVDHILRILLALLSVVFSFLSLVSDFVNLGPLPEVLMLSLTITKVAFFDAINIILIIFRLPQKKKKKKNAPPQSPPLSKEKQKTHFWHNPKIRESYLQIMDDTLGALPAVLAVGAFNAHRNGDSFLFEDTTTMLCLGILAFIVKLPRLVHELSCIVCRRSELSMPLTALLTNSMGILASSFSLAHLLVFDLVVGNVLSPNHSIWFIPVLHVPILKKVKKSIQKPHVRSYMYGE